MCLIQNNELNGFFLCLEGGRGIREAGIGRPTGAIDKRANIVQHHPPDRTARPAGQIHPHAPAHRGADPVDGRSARDGDHRGGDTLKKLKL